MSLQYLVFTNTPAHVHLYKHAVRRLLADGHAVLVLARDYTCTVDLLDYYDIDHEVYGACGTTKRSLLTRLPAQYLRAVRAARRFDPDLIFGMGGYAAHTGALTRTPTVLVIDSEPADFDHAISTPFARAILTPATFRKHLGDHHYVFDGLKECAYLHPAVFEPDPSIREALDVDPEEPFVILRLNAFGSQHDVGKDGFTQEQCQALVERLAASATVLVSDEGDRLDLSGIPARSFDLHPARLHDALREAALLVADTQTMVTEAALLGTPAIRSNSFVGAADMGNFLALESAGLVRNCEDFPTVRDTAVELLETPGIDADWEQKREAFLSKTVDLSSLVVDVARVRGLVEGLDAVRPAGEERRTTEAPQLPLGGDD